MTSTVITLTSCEPLQAKTLTIKKIYLIDFTLMLLGIVIPPMLGIGMLGLIVTYIVDDLLTTNHRDKLRTMKFQFNNNITSKELFETLNTSFISKFNGKMQLKKNENGTVTFVYEDHIYDLLINGDGTFSLWWKKSLEEAFLSFNIYKSYKQIRTAMGIIAYEIQQCCHSMNENQDV